MFNLCPRVILSDHGVKNIWKTRQQLGLHGESKIFRFLGFLKCGFLTKNVKIVNVHWKKCSPSSLSCSFSINEASFGTCISKQTRHKGSATLIAPTFRRRIVFSNSWRCHTKVSGRTMIKEIAATLAWFSAVNLSRHMDQWQNQSNFCIGNGCCLLLCFCLPCQIAESCLCYSFHLLRYEP